MNDIQCSFEFFPPHTPKGCEGLRATAKQLAKLNPEYFSVTYGAGGSTQKNTPKTILDLKNTTNIDVAPHLSCVGSSEDVLKSLLQEYQKHSIQRIIALRGDKPSGAQTRSDFQHASDLVGWIKQEYGNQFKIYVACYPECHPESANARTDFQQFCHKVSLGADAAITQYFFNIDAFLHFRDLCAQHQLNIPIIPGIMPISNYHKLAHFSQNCGAEIPRWVRKTCESLIDDVAGLQAFGVDFVTGLCENLIREGVDNFHFYALNQIEPSQTICENLLK